MKTSLQMCHMRAHERLTTLERLERLVGTDYSAEALAATPALPPTAVEIIMEAGRADALPIKWTIDGMEDIEIPDDRSYRLLTGELLPVLVCACPELLGPLRMLSGRLEDAPAAPPEPAHEPEAKPAPESAARPSAHLGRCGP